MARGALVLAVPVLLLLRAPQLLTTALLEEEVGGFWLPTFLRSPLETLAMPWTGFLHVLSRAAFLLTRVTDLAPALVIVVTLTAIAAFVASDRLSEAIPDRRVRILAGASVVLLPFASAAVYTTVLDLHFFGAIYLGCLFLASAPRTFGWRVADTVGAGIAVLNGPVAIVMAPLFATRRGLVPTIILAGAVVQVVTFVLSPRRPALDPLAILAVGAAVVLAGVGIVSLRALPDRTTLVLSYLSAAFIIAGTLAVGPLVTESPRYFIIAAWTAALVGLAALARRQMGGAVLTGLFVAALVLTFRTDRYGVDGWRCIGREPCTVGTVVWPTDRVPVGFSPAGFVYD